MDGLTFLETDPGGEPKPLYVLHGDDDFLRRLVIAALKQRILGAEGEEFGFAAHPGDRAVWHVVHDELLTLPFLSPRRLVVVENADPFVTRHRLSLEKYAGKPAARGVLVLDVKSWPGNTKLARMIDADATLVCKAPAKIADWCRQWAKSQYGKQLTVHAAQLLVDHVGNSMGLLDQEIAKLSVYVGDLVKIDEAAVDKLVGQNRSETVFRIFNFIGQGKTSEALALLDQLLTQGASPLQLLSGPLGWQLRRLAQANRLNAQGVPLRDAIERAGLRFPDEIERQMRHLGRRRLNRLYDWLLEADQGMKGHSQLTERMLLERLIIRLAQPNPAAPARR